MKRKFQIYLVIVLFLGTSCASTYKTINTSQQSYNNKQVIDGYLEIGYKYDIYYTTSNKKYLKKEWKYGYKTVAIEIKNISPIPILITNNNFSVYLGETQIQPVNTDLYLKQVKQPENIYILHALWGPWSFQTWSDSNGNSGGKVSYFPVGLAVGLINGLVADIANKKHNKNINELNIFNKIIEPNEKISGIICFKYNNYDPLTFKYLD